MTGARIRSDSRTNAHPAEQVRTKDGWSVGQGGAWAPMWSTEADMLHAELADMLSKAHKGDWCRLPASTAICDAVELVTDEIAPCRRHAVVVAGLVFACWLEIFGGEYEQRTLQGVRGWYGIDVLLTMRSKALGQR